MRTEELMLMLRHRTTTYTTASGETCSTLTMPEAAWKKLESVIAESLYLLGESEYPSKDD
jgi:hypothetical protein